MASICVVSVVSNASLILNSGWMFAFVWQWLVRTRTMIKVCLSLGAVSTGLLGIILVSTGTAKGLVGLIFLVFALFQGLYVHLVRHRIPFAAIMLNRTRGVVKKYKSLHLISMWTVFLAMFWLEVWIFGVSGAVSLPYGGWYAALLVVSLAWSMEVLRNIVYITVAGVVGQHYYEGHNHMPHSLVLRAYRRAWTISFGSMYLGSMFVAPVQTLHAIGLLRLKEPSTQLRCREQDLPYIYRVGDRRTHLDSIIWNERCRMRVVD